MPRIVRQKIEFEGRIEEREVVIEGDDLAVWPAGQAFRVIGTPLARVDGAERVGGAARYTADLYPAGVLSGAFLRSPHAHARIRRLDASRAEAVPGVRLVLSHLTTPRIPWYNGMSWLFDPELRYAGDEVALVVAEDAAAARDALDLIDVEYEVLPHVVDPLEALRPGAPQVHPQGNILGGAPERYARGTWTRGSGWPTGSSSWTSRPRTSSTTAWRRTGRSRSGTATPSSSGTRPSTSSGCAGRWPPPWGSRSAGSAS